MKRYHGDENVAVCKVTEMMSSQYTRSTDLQYTTQKNHKLMNIQAKRPHYLNLPDKSIRLSHNVSKIIDEIKQDDIAGGDRATFKLETYLDEEEEPSMYYDSATSYLISRPPTQESLIHSCIQYKFVFFLGIQGKEYIDDISQKFPSWYRTSVLFVTANYQHPRKAKAKHKVSDNQQCKVLAKELGILDPLGGGCYPMDHLIIVDGAMQVRSSISLSIKDQATLYRRQGTRSFRNEGGTTYAKFGLEFGQLDSFIEENLNYFTAVHSS